MYERTAKNILLQVGVGEPCNKTKDVLEARIEKTVNDLSKHSTTKEEIFKNGKEFVFYGLSEKQRSCLNNLKK